MHEKDLRLSLLFDCYSELLRPQQRRMFDLYYNEDLSLSEIAEQCGITRQGVRDLCKRAEEELRGYEDALHLSKRFAALSEQAGQMRQILSKLRADAAKGNEDDILSAAEQMERALQKIEELL